MNNLQTTYALAIIGTLAVSGASMAATSTLDSRIAEANRVAAVSSNYHVTAASLVYCYFAASTRSRKPSMRKSHTK